MRAGADNIARVRPEMLKGAFLGLSLLVLPSLAAVAQQETQGMILYRQPSSTYTEAIEYRSFRQDNALYSTIVTSAGERKQLKSGAVLALVPYPSSSFDPALEEAGERAVHTIQSLEQAYPQVKPQLEVARAKWIRALSVLEQIRKAPKATATPGRRPSSNLPREARLTRVTADSATIMHATGVTTLRLADLSPEQVLSLNATSRTVQLPLGVEGSATAAQMSGNAPMPGKESDLTRRIEAAGRSAIAFSTRKLSIEDKTFSVWTFFVILPTLVLGLLVAVVLLARRLHSGIAQLPERRPFS